MRLNRGTDVTRTAAVPTDAGREGLDDRPGPGDTRSEGEGDERSEL